MVSAKAKTPGLKDDRKRESATREPVSKPFAEVVPRLRKALADAKTQADKRKQTSTPVTSVAEDRSFAEHMRNVMPLAGKPGRVSRSADPGHSATQKQARDSSGCTDCEQDESASWRFEVHDDGVLLEGRRIDVDPRELRRLRTKRYPVDGKLDLHGMSVAAARRMTLEFVARRRSQGDRVVEIVHGRGSHSPRGEAVLRGELGAWLSQGIAINAVLAFVSVVERDDVSGAVVVLLAKR